MPVQMDNFDIYFLRCVVSIFIMSDPLNVKSSLRSQLILYENKLSKYKNISQPINILHGVIYHSISSGGPYFFVLY